jgi:hypothetical protein
MGANEDVHKLEHELEQERHELRDTVDQIDQKLGRTGDWLDPLTSFPATHSHY